jgi:RNA polymerase sigma factor (TIGR02999 family)
MSETGEFTRLLRGASEGRREDLDRLVPMVYEELRGIARAHLRGERAGHTLNTTALVHEAYLKLVDVHSATWKDRAHFCAMASRAMRRILIDHARARLRLKRGGEAVRVDLDEAANLPDDRAVELIELDEALDRLEAIDARQARFVECRFFAGLTLEETAEALGVSLATAKRDWALCRAWLNREMSGGMAGFEPA